MAAPGSREFTATVPPRSPVLLVAAAVAFLVPLSYVLVASLGAPAKVRYEIDRGFVVIHTAKGFTGDSKKIAIGRIEEITPLSLRNGKLQFGAEKGGYCVGFFEYTFVGEVWQATDCAERGLVIRAGGETHPVVIAPADPDAFIAAVRDGKPGTFPTAATPHGVSWTLFATLAVLLWPLAGTLAFLALFASGRVRYLVRPGELEVRSAFGRQRFALAGARAHAHIPLLGERLSGVGVPGYWSGVWAYDTAPTAVVATSRDQGVLVESDVRLFVSPADRQAFLAALAGAGAAVSGTT